MSCWNSVGSKFLKLRILTILGGGLATWVLIAAYSSMWSNILSSKFLVFLTEVTLLLITRSICVEEVLVTLVGLLFITLSRGWTVVIDAEVCYRDLIWLCPHLFGGSHSSTVTNDQEILKLEPHFFECFGKVIEEGRVWRGPVVPKIWAVDFVVIFSQIPWISWLSRDFNLVEQT